MVICVHCNEYIMRRDGRWVLVGDDNPDQDLARHRPTIR